MTLHSPNNRQAGLTLLEAMIVMAILTLVMGIAGVSYQRFVTSQRSDEKEIAALSERIQVIRLKALAQSEIIKLELRDIVPPDITLCDSAAHHNAIFHKNGTVALGQICIIGSDNTRKIVLIDWTTGGTAFAE